MNGHDSGRGLERLEQVERRLEAALHARADSVGLSGLRPARPPSGSLPTRLTARRATFALLAVAALVVCALFAMQQESHTPTRPMAPPAVTETPTPTPAPASPQPSAVASPPAATASPASREM